ncbi:MAG: bleomycin resistance protein [Betaproteobacteria bacterium RBG_16_58_11]|nr:MAG: bleomycin resistance protein [Betaproteobacteria bacterium RBG_16_58_11]
MLQGLRTVIYGVNDIAHAKAWYSQALGMAPYFDESFYVGFNVGGDELGLNPNTPPNSAENAGVVAYWGVEDIAAEFKRLLEIGGKEHSAIQDVGDGIQVATLLDPFGNILGLIHNPHFKIGNHG